jgi:hypothetical protein
LAIDERHNDMCSLGGHVALAAVLCLATSLAVGVNQLLPRGT